MVTIEERAFELSDAIRYIAVYKRGELSARQRPGVRDASSSESDRYEELFVNPALLTLARQRDELDCGGLRLLVVAYGNFYQVVLPLREGHLSACVERSADVISIARRLEVLVSEGETTPAS